MKLCDFGCGNAAKYYFKTSGKWCCNKYHSQCPAVKKEMSKKYKGKRRSIETRKKISEACKGRVLSEETKKKISRKCKGRKGYWEGKKLYPHIIKKISGPRITITYIRKKYPYFSKIEEMRYNPNNKNKKEIQVRCRNHNCRNSKENNGWFTPSRSQLYERIRQIENEDGNEGSYFYCSELCKMECPLFNLYSDPTSKNKKTIYTQDEYKQFRQFVLERDNYKCQYCGKKAEHVHHEKPQKLEPFFSLDPDLAWSVCKECHYKYGHKDECSTGKLAKITCGNI